MLCRTLQRYLCRSPSLLRSSNTFRGLNAHEKVAALVEIDIDRMDASLFDDPTGGLTLAEGQELTQSELCRELQESPSHYDPVLFYVAFTPIVDLVDLLVKRRLVPPLNADAAVSSWFQDPRLLMANPQLLALSMGAERYRDFRLYLEEYIDLTDGMMPLRRAMERQQTPHELLCPYLRTVGCALWSRQWDIRSAASQKIPGIALALCNGKAAGTLALPEDALLRTEAVADILVGLGQEIASPGIAFLAVQILRANNLEVPYRLQKALTNVFSAVQRTKTDWDLRSTGLLKHAYPRWTTKYLRQVGADASTAQSDVFLQGSTEPVSTYKLGSSRSSSSSGTEGALELPIKQHQHQQHEELDDVSSYFQRRLNHDISSMQKNIAASLDSRKARGDLTSNTLSKPRGRKGVKKATLQQNVVVNV